MAQLEDLYTTNPGTVNVPAPAQQDPASKSLTGAQQATATGFDASTRQAGGAEMSSNQMNRITAQDSPLM